MRASSISTPRSRQVGAGLLGWLVILAIGSFFLTCLFKIGPVYLDYWQAKQVLDDAVTSSNPANLSKTELVQSIQKRLDVSRIEAFTAKDLRINETRDGRELDASYEKRIPLLSNIDVVVKFDKLKYPLPPAP